MLLQGGNPAWGASDMKKIASAIAAIAVLTAAPAIAADMPIKVPGYAPPPPVWSWSGFYVGVNAGASIGHSPTTDTQVFTSAATGPVTLFNELVNHSPSGGLFGAQVGVNWQIGRFFVVGAEADWQWTGENDTARLFGCGAQTTGFFGAGGQGFNNCLNDEQKLQSFGTARFRGGVTTGDWLWYVTGGAAWGQVNDSQTLTIATVIPGGPLAAGTTSSGFSHEKAGWTVGAGVETRLWGGFTAKLEYLYLDLGTYTDTFVIPAAAAGNTVTTTSTSHFTDHILRVGLNYKFDWGLGLVQY